MSLLNLLFPPLCVLCGNSVTSQQTLCVKCWDSMTFIGKPYCFCCGMPFSVPVDEETLCGACLSEHPPFIKLRSALVYDDECRPLILRFKHADKLNLAPIMANLLQQYGQELWQDTKNKLLLVPVPLHPLRLLRRRYNQAAILAQMLGKKTGIAVAVDALLRVRSTPTQGHKTRKERARNVAGAFQINSRWRDTLTGHKIILVDDVVTTGATLCECAKVLAAIGVRDVNALSVARVVMTNI